MSSRILHLFVTVFLLTATIGCDPVVRESKAPREGFNINGLLDSLELQVVSGNPLLIKKALLNSEVDSTQMRLDSAGWSKEFQVFSDMKLTPGRLKGRYDFSIVELDSGLLYQYIAKDSKYQQLDSFFIVTDVQKRPKQLQAYIHYSNSLNTTEKELMMEWGAVKEKIVPVLYKTKGWQKMRISDTVNFEVEARLAY